MTIMAPSGTLPVISSSPGGKIGGIVSKPLGSTAPKSSDPSSSRPSSGNVAWGQPGTARSLGSAASASATADPLPRGLFEALAGIGGALQAGLPGASRDPSMVAVDRAATLRLRATVERYFQF